MKYVITGAAGHISKPLALHLLKTGHQVTVIGRNANNLATLVEAGAKAAIGMVDDIDFLAKTFTGADAIYTMVPPNFAVTDWKAAIEQVGKNYTVAIKASGVKYVVNLSSIGAHLPDGCGPVSGLYRVEQSLNTLTGVNIKHLRPAFFYENLFANISLIKQAGIMGGNYGTPPNGEPGKGFVIVDTNDIANVAAEELLNLHFTGHSARYISSDEVSVEGIAKAIGSAIGKPELPWVVFSDEQALQAMTGMGLPEEIAKNYIEMGVALRTGVMSEDYWKHRPATLGNVKVADFAKVFAGAYNAYKGK